MRTIWLHTATLTTMFVTALPVGAQPSAGAAQQPELVRQLAVDDAVELALENNLGIQVERFNPQLADLNIAQVLGAWSPMLTSALQGGSTDSPNNSFLSGAQGVKTIDERVTTDFAFEQPLRWGARYSVGWDGSRSTTTNLFSNFSPQLRSSLSLSYQQSLLRGFFIDAPRQQLLVSRVNRDISDIELRQTIAVTSRTVRNAYWELAYAIALLDVQRQSLALAEESLRNTRARVEIGTTPPIDIVESEAEVALREEAVILGEAQIESAEDILRALVYDPNDPDFWTMRIEPAGAPPFDPVVVDLELVTRNALERRTDLQQARKTLESNDVTIRFLRNETLPDITAGFDYGLTGLGGTQFIRGAGFPGPVIGSTGRGFGSVLGDVFGNDFPNWTASLNISYPLGSDQSEAKPCARTPPAEPGADAAQEPGTTGGHRGQGSCAPGDHQPEASGHDMGITGARRTPAGRRGTQVHGRHIHELLRVPGATRPGASPQQRAPGNPGPQSVGRGSRDRTGGAPDSTVGCHSAVPNLSVTIIALNEAEHVGTAVDSASWADEIIVVDCGSTDGTVDIARSKGAIVSHRDWTGYVDQKNHASSLASHDWIFSLDADERIPSALAAEVRAVISAEPPLRGYRVPRVTFHLGRWFRTTDFYPDYQTRLYNRLAGSWRGKHVHESVTVDGPVGRLTQELEHRPYRDLREHLARINAYSTLAARQMHEAGTPLGPPAARRAPAAGLPSQLRAPARFPRWHGGIDALGRQRPMPSS